MTLVRGRFLNSWSARVAKSDIYCRWAVIGLFRGSLRLICPINIDSLSFEKLILPIFGISRTCVTGGHDCVCSSYESESSLNERGIWVREMDLSSQHVIVMNPWYLVKSHEKGRTEELRYILPVSTPLSWNLDLDTVR